MAEAQVMEPSADPVSSGTGAAETGSKVSGSSAATAEVQTNGASAGTEKAHNETDRVTTDPDASKATGKAAKGETSNLTPAESTTTKATEGDTSKAADKDSSSNSIPKLKSTAEPRDRRNGSYSGRGSHSRDYNGRSAKRGGIKSIMDEQEPSSDPVAIRKQVEFYFSDSNLVQDRFLFSKVGGPANNAVPIDVIHSFKRMRHFQPRKAVVDALKESSTLDVVEDDTAIKRKEAMQLPEDWEKLQDQNEIEKVYEDQTMARSVYAKGFGDEKASSQFDIEAWFSQYGPTNQVRLRRADDKSFKGSVFVEFDSEDTAKSFLKVDPLPKYNGHELIIKSKKQYCDEKVEDINSGRIRANEKGFKKGKREDRDWRERRDEFQKHGFKGDRHGGRGGRNPYGGRRRGSPQGRDRHEYVPSAWLAMFSRTWVQCGQCLRLLSSKTKSSGSVTASPESGKKRARDDAAEQNEGSPKAKKTQVEAAGKASTNSAMRDEGVQTDLADEKWVQEAAKSKAPKDTEPAGETVSEASRTADLKSDETVSGESKMSAKEAEVPTLKEDKLVKNAEAGKES